MASETGFRGNSNANGTCRRTKISIAFGRRSDSRKRNCLDLNVAWRRLRKTRGRQPKWPDSRRHKTNSRRFKTGSRKEKMRIMLNSGSKMLCEDSRQRRRRTHCRRDRPSRDAKLTRKSRRSIGRRPYASRIG